MPEYRHVEVENKAGVMVVHFQDHQMFGEQVLQKIGEEMGQLAASDECDRLLLSFAGVGFLSSAALGKLITLNKRMKERGGQLKLCDICPEVQSVFTLTSLNQIFDIQEDEAAALKAFEAA